MERENIEILSDAIKEYFGNYEFDELCSRFGLEIEYLGLMGKTGRGFPQQ